MNVASLELSTELYKLSGWEADKKWRNPWNLKEVFDTPKYDLGHLLRKLPYRYVSGDIKGFLTISMGEISAVASYKTMYGDNLTFHRAETPEDALCKLAIELFKQGTLTRETAPNIT